MILEILAIGGALIFLIVVSVIGWWVGTYNTFQRAKQDIATQWSNVKSEYQRRADLIYNLVESTKSFKKHERGTLEAVMKARSGAFGGTKQQEMKSMKGLNSAFGRLLAVFEQYPVLKAGEQHNKLMDEIRITEDRINIGRTDYNNIVGDYNTLVLSFPANIIANHYKFEKEIFFENEKGTEKAPKIDLG